MIPLVNPTTMSGQAAWAVLFALAAGCFWALAQLYGKMSVRTADSLTFNCIRFAVFVPLTLTLVGAQGGLELPSGLDLGGIMAAGVLSWYASAQLYFYVLKREDMSIAAPVANSYPAIGAVMAVLFLGERPSMVLAPVIGMVLLGVFMLKPASTEKRWRWGVPLSLVAALGWASSLALTRFFVVNIDGTSILFIKAATSGVGFWLTALMLRSHIRPALNRFSLASGLCLAVGETCFMSAIAIREASFVSPILSSSIPFGFFFSVFFLGERPNRIKYLGMALIFVAILFLYIYG